MESHKPLNLDIQKAQHPFLVALRNPEFWGIVQSILSRPSVVLLVPEKSSIEGVIVDDLFAITHCAFLNPLNPSEVVTANGLIGVIGRLSGGSKELHIISAGGKVNTKDPSQTFDSIRPALTQFSLDGHILQSIPVLGETEVLISKQLIRAFIIQTAVQFPGSPWKRTNPQNDLLQLSSLPLNTSQGSFDKFHTELKPHTMNQEKTTQTKQTSQISSQTPSNSNRPSLPASSSNTASNTSTVKAGSEEASFLVRLKNAPEIRDALTNFVNGFATKTPPASEQGTVVRKFIDDILSRMMHHKAWADATMDDYEIALEASEKYVMQKLYKFCFSNTTEDIAKDKIIHARFQEIQFITEDHLDISIHHRDPQRTQQAIEQLRLINSSKTPRGKLIRVLNCCKAIYSILNRASQQGFPAGADEFLPILNYVVLKANPPHLYSNIQYIHRFRSPNKMITEAGYYFTHLESTISWLEKVDASKLSIDPDEFHRLLKQHQQQPIKRSQSQAQVSEADTPVVPRVEAGGVSLISFVQNNKSPRDLIDWSHSVDSVASNPLMSTDSASKPFNSVDNDLNLLHISPRTTTKSTLSSQLLNDLVWTPNSSISSPSLSSATNSRSTLSSPALSRDRDDDSETSSQFDALDVELPMPADDNWAKSWQSPSQF